MNSLVPINVWNAKDDKQCHGEALYCVFNMCREICDLNLYLDTCGERDSKSSLTHMRQPWVRNCLHWPDQMVRLLAVAQRSVEMCR